MRKHKLCPKCLRNIVQYGAGPKEKCAFCHGFHRPHMSSHYKYLRRRAAGLNVGRAGLGSLLARRWLAEGFKPRTTVGRTR